MKNGTETVIEREKAFIAEERGGIYPDWIGGTNQGIRRKAWAGIGDPGSGG